MFNYVGGLLVWCVCFISMVLKYWMLDFICNNYKMILCFLLLFGVCEPAWFLFLFSPICLYSSLAWVWFGDSRFLFCIVKVLFAFVFLIWSLWFRGFVCGYLGFGLK